MDPLKYYMTIKLPKRNQCSIYPERKETKTVFHHIFSRPTQALTDDPNNVIELGDYADSHHTEYETKKKIYEYKFFSDPSWCEWYLANYKSPKGVVYDPKGYQIFLEITAHR
jgi:hypothetical protein